MWKKETQKLRFYGIQAKLLCIFFIIYFVIFLTSFVLYESTHNKMEQIEKTYTSNANLMEMQKNLKQMQQAVSVYLNTKDRDSLEKYYDCVNDHEKLSANLNMDTVDDENLIMEKNIRNLSQVYISLLDKAIEAKLGRNIEKYEKSFMEASKIYQYLDAGIYGLNNLQFHSNSIHYQSLMDSLEYSESINIIILLIIGVTSVFLIEILTLRFTKPLKQLAVTARKVGKGDLEVQVKESGTKDEVGIVTEEFNKMVSSLRFYIEKQKESLELENAMKKKEILMETHLKDAQLKYLQAQIHPHFLFNTLNMIAKTAYIGDSDKTVFLLQKTAQLLRYSLDYMGKSVTLAREMEMLGNYVYLQEQRFGERISFEFDLDESFHQIQVPCLILQPLVENAITHGVGGYLKDGQIKIRTKYNVERKMGEVSVEDNGYGMTKEQLEKIKKDLDCPQIQREKIGLANVYMRIKLFYGEKASFEMESVPMVKTKILIRMPWESK